MLKVWSSRPNSGIKMYKIVNILFFVSLISCVKEKSVEQKIKIDNSLYVCEELTDDFDEILERSLLESRKNAFCK